MQIRINVVTNGVYVKIYYNAYDMDACKSYFMADWKHVIAHFGDMLPLTSCEIVVHSDI
jgi:hypothetical protein